MAKKRLTPQQKWVKKNREKLRAACRRWRARHPDKQKAATYRWRRRNLKKWNAYQRAWRRKNKNRTNPVLRKVRLALGDSYNAKRRDYRQRNLEKLRRAARRYYAANQERKRIEHHLAMAKRKQAIGSYSLTEWRALLAKYNYRCAYCNSRLTKRTASADHLVPLSKGGTNWIKNIVPACLPCNQRKSFLTSREYLRRLKRRWRH